MLRAAAEVAKSARKLVELVQLDQLIDFCGVTFGVLSRTLMHLLGPFVSRDVITTRVEKTWGAAEDRSRLTAAPRRALPQPAALPVLRPKPNRMGSSRRCWLFGRPEPSRLAEIRPI
jgi:hypothetical protein